MDFAISNVERNVILQMTSKEQTVRYSDGIQEAYTKEYHYSKNPNHKRVNIEAKIQKYILRQFGFKDDENSLKEYWKIPSAYWNDEEIKNSIFYMKLNIFQYPKIKLEYDLIDVDLIDYKTNRIVPLSSLQQPEKPLILLSGSMT